MDKTSEILSVSDQIVEDILNSILRGEVKLGQKLPTETDLAKLYGVSRPTIRNALVALENQHILSSRQGCQGGWFVSSNDTYSVAKILGRHMTFLLNSNQITSQDLFEVRSMIEIKSCGLAALRRTPEDLQAIAASIPVNHEGLNDYEYHSQDIEFHRRVAQATHNPLIILTIDITAMIQELYAMSSPAPEKKRQLLNQSLFDIYQAIVNQDVRGAEEAMHNHLYFFKKISKNISFE